MMFQKQYTKEIAENPFFKFYKRVGFNIKKIKLMKKFIIFLFAGFLCSYINSHAQIQNGGFEQFNNCVWNDPLSSCDPVGVWKTSHGFPWVDNQGCEGAKYAIIPSANPHSGCDAGGTSGIFYQFPEDLIPGQEYEISFCYRNVYLDDDEVLLNFTVALTKGLVDDITPSTCDQLPLYPLCPSCTIFNNTVTNADWNTFTGTFTVPELSSFDQIIFHTDCISGCDSPGSVDLDGVSLTTSTPCDQTQSDCDISTDLTACEAEDNFGYIVLECEGDFSWEFPAGSTATEHTTDNQSIILSASEGHYAVTITDGNGCTHVEEFDILEACCGDEPVEPCVANAPFNLDCTVDDEDPGIINLIWDPVPGAIGYEVLITVNDPYCGICTPQPGYSLYYFVTDAFFKLPEDLVVKCFSWQVKTVCSDTDISPPSKKKCHNIQSACWPHAPSYDPVSDLNKPVQSEKEITVFPNPGSGKMTFEINLSEPGSLQIELFDLRGQKIQSIDYGEIPSGLFTATWNLQGQLTNGVYIAHFNMGTSSFQKKVYINNK